MTRRCWRWFFAEALAVLANFFGRLGLAALAGHNGIRCLGLLLIGAFCSLTALAFERSIPRFPAPRQPPPDAQMRKAMASIDQHHKREARQCAQEVALIQRQEKTSRLDGTYSLRYQVVLDNPRIFAVTSALEVYCAGAYPAFAENAITFDRSTGQKYDPLKLYALTQRSGDSVQVVPEVRQMIRAEWLARRGPGVDDDCKQILKADELRFFDADTVTFTPTGLLILYTGPHAVQACYEPVTLSYASLKKFLRPEEASRLGWPAGRPR
jgi:hypothetical protein